MVGSGIPPIASNAAVANGPVTFCWREVMSRCGLRGMRVGEASHPGPHRQKGFFPFARDPQ